MKERYNCAQCFSLGLQEILGRLRRSERISMYLELKLYKSRYMKGKPAQNLEAAPCLPHLLGKEAASNSGGSSGGTELCTLPRMRQAFGRLKTE